MDDDEAQSKKPRLDENKFDDKTSTYDLSDEDDMGDDEPFTLVTYKKKRAEGIPVVFRPTSEGASFWQVNPNRVSAEIVSAAKEKVQSFRTTRDGSFSVSVASLASAKRLLMLANAARKAKLLQKCAVMSLSMEENRAPMNPFQTLRLFIQYVIHLSGHRNKSSRETHQENRQEHIQETNQKKYVQAPRPTHQSCERP
ncbi:hypothetical protein MTO96_015979 [Rhipicephalus appendiculatus]